MARVPIFDVTFVQLLQSDLSSRARRFSPHNTHKDVELLPLNPKSKTAGVQTAGP